MRINRANDGGRRLDALISSALAFAILLTVHAVAEASEAKAAPPGIDRGAALVPSKETAATRVLQPWATLDTASRDVRYLADWVARTGDNAGMPYVIIDKVHATVFVMDSSGHLDGSAPALLGMGQGDGSIAGIGDRKLSTIRPDERTTPAGRFIASLGKDLHGQEILGIDYANAIALHRVVKGTPAERRAQRLQSETSDDNRISYGCINVPVKFYDDIVHPAFATTSGVVYILPEMSSAQALFGGLGKDAQSAHAAPESEANTASATMAPVR
jgi:hypothetical protein